MWRLQWRYCPQCVNIIGHLRHSSQSTAATARVPPTPSDYQSQGHQQADWDTWFTHLSSESSYIPIKYMPRELLNELLLAAGLPSPMPPEVESSEPFTNVVNDEHPALASEPVAIIEGASDAIHPSTDAVTAQISQITDCELMDIRQMLSRTTLVSGEEALRNAVIVCEHTDLPTTIDFLKRVVRDSYFHLPVSMRQYPSSLEKASRRLVRTALRRDPNCSHTSSLFAALLAEGFICDSRIVLEEAVRHNLETGNFEAAFSRWASRVNSERSAAGAFALFQHAILAIVSGGRRRGLEDRIEEIMTVYNETHSPLASFAELIVALISVGEAEEADYLATELSIPPSYFIAPLAHLATMENIQAVENFALFVEKRILSELRPKKKKAKKQRRIAVRTTKPQDIDEHDLEEFEPAPAPPPPAPMRQFSFVVERYTSMNPRTEQKKKMKVQKRKMDAKQVDELTSTLLRTWMELAQDLSNKSALERVEDWAMRNRIELPSPEELVA